MIWFSKENRERSRGMLLTQSPLCDKRMCFDDRGMFFCFYLNWGGRGGKKKESVLWRQYSNLDLLYSFCSVNSFFFDTSFPKILRVDPYGWYWINYISCFPNTANCCENLVGQLHGSIIYTSQPALGRNLY